MEDYWLIISTPNEIGISDTFLMKVNDIPIPLREKMLQNHKKNWFNFTFEEQKQLVVLEEKSISLDSEEYNPTTHKIAKVLKYYILKSG